MNKILIIEDGKDSVDIFINDGGYAYCWIGERGGYIIEYYQGRIDIKVDYDNPYEDVALNNNYNNYRRTYRKDAKFNTVLKNVVNWLVAGSSLNDFEITTIESSEKDYDIVNNFLNIK
jgi:hypothetical protein